MYKVMIVDDEQMVINSLALGFDWKAYGCEVVAAAAGSAEALRLIQLIRPDIVFIDIRMPVINGLELMERVHKSLPWLLFVVISGYADFCYAQQAIQMGAVGYCLKPLETEELEQVINAARKHLDTNQDINQTLFDRLLRSPDEQNAEAFIRKLYPEDSPPVSLTLAVSVGEADSLLSGKAGYRMVRAGDNCRVYFILTNPEYLSSVVFETSLMSLHRRKEIASFVWKTSADPTGFLVSGLPVLIDCAYSYFMGGDVSLGRAEEAEANDGFLKEAASLANQGRTIELIDLLDKLDAAEALLLPSQAVQLYSLCEQLACRLNDSPYSQTVSYVFELADRFVSFEDMKEELVQRLLRINESVDPQSVRNETFRKVLEYVNRNYASAVSFQDICREYCINASYLSQLFKKEIGTTFTSYIRNLRIQYAKELLETTTLRISEIAEKVGYDYDYSFTKLFKRETGYTPREYRELKGKI